MRISDWSSDVCSSDLGVTARADSSPTSWKKEAWHKCFVTKLAGRSAHRAAIWSRPLASRSGLRNAPSSANSATASPNSRWSTWWAKAAMMSPQAALISVGLSILFHLSVALAPFLPPKRSEEHTSELQSLMRISYAVFFLKKKKNKNKKY